MSGDFKSRRQEWGMFAAEVLSADDAPHIHGDQSVFDDFDDKKDDEGHGERIARSGDVDVFKRDTQKYEPGMVISRDMGIAHAPPGKEDQLSASFVLTQKTDAVTIRVMPGEVMVFVYPNGKFTNINMETHLGENFQICPGKFLDASLFPLVGVIILEKSADKLIQHGPMADEFRRNFHKGMVNAESIARGEKQVPGFKVSRIGKKKKRYGGVH